MVSKPERETMKTTDLKKITGLNLPTELPCTNDLIFRLERHLADERTIQSRLSADDPNYQRSHTHYTQRITTLEQILEQLRQPNFQFDQEPIEQPKPACDLVPHSRGRSAVSVPQVPPVPQVSQVPETTFPTQNPPPSGSTLQSQQDPTDSEVGPSGSEVVSSGFQPVSGGPQPVSNESKPLPQSAPEAANSETPTARPSTRPLTIYNRLSAEKKLDSEDIQELIIDLEEHKTGRSPLDKLSPEIQTAIISLMAERPTWIVCQLLSQPAPTGLGLHTSESSLNRFRQRYKEQLERKRRQTRRDEIEDIVVSNHGDMFKSTVHLMESRLIKALSNDQTATDDLQRISRSLATLRRQALAEGNPVDPYVPVAQVSQPAVSPASSRQSLESPTAPDPTHNQPTPDYEL